ncbi:MAG: DUF1566 domain-containing protein [Betaproteobacteria bacterium]|nr:DUF1566 domain-containing protein [Betaproteobacteria bacterium]
MLQAPADYNDHGNGTVTHNKTGLMWKRCAEAASELWDGSTCTGSAATYTWAAALTKAKDSSFAGYSDWRLPNKKELESIVETCGYNPAINTTFFPNTPTSFYFWTATSYAPNVAYAWIVIFSYGDLHAYGKANTNYARLVRGGQGFDNFDLLGVPPAPTVSAATPANSSATVSFYANANGSTAIDNFRVTCNPGSHTATGSASPIAVPGLTNGVTYTCTAAAHNSSGWSPESAPSNPVTPPGVQRAFVAAITGSNANVTTNCSVTAPCQTFAMALNAVVPGGEIIATESGEYGRVTLDRSVTLLGAPGQVAAITVNSGNAVTIATPSIRVVLRGLQIRGIGTPAGTRGIFMSAAGAKLDVENCVISGFSNSGYGILETNGAEINVSETLLRNNTIGMYLSKVQRVSVSRSKFLDVSKGIEVQKFSSDGASKVSITRSVVRGNKNGTGIYASCSGGSAALAISRSDIGFHSAGVSVVGTSSCMTKVVLDRSRVSGNTVGLQQDGAGATLYSRGNNSISGNTTNTSGTITPLAGM